jgi:small subunit ribosomal protein S16
MAVVIRLKRAGAKKRPFYRLVAADSRRQRDGRFLEILGHYNPIAQPFELVVQREKIESWIAKGAQPSDQVASLLRSLGIATMAPKTGPLNVAQAAVAPEAAPAVAATKKAAKKAAKKPAKRAVKKKVSDRKTKAKVARKTKPKPAAKKKAKKK